MKGVGVVGHVVVHLNFRTLLQRPGGIRRAGSLRGLLQDAVVGLNRQAALNRGREETEGGGCHQHGEPLEHDLLLSFPRANVFQEIPRQPDSSYSQKP